MVRRTTWVILVIFAVLIGFAWLFERFQTKKADVTATQVPTQASNELYNLAGAKVSDIKISNTSGDHIELYQDTASKKWAIKDIPADKADSFQIESVSAQLFALQAKEVITGTVPLDSVGLTTPTYTITLITTGGAQLITYVGSQTAIGSGYYVRVASGPVAVVDKTIMDDILKLLTTPPLLPTPTPEVTPTETIPPTEIGTQATPTP